MHSDISESIVGIVGSIVCSHSCKVSGTVCTCKFSMVSPLIGVFDQELISVFPTFAHLCLLPVKVECVVVSLAGDSAAILRIAQCDCLLFRTMRMFVIHRQISEDVLCQFRR